MGNPVLHDSILYTGDIFFFLLTHQYDLAAGNKRGKKAGDKPIKGK